MQGTWKSLDDIRNQLADGRFEFSRHGFRRAVERNISDNEIRQAGRFAKVIEDYPDDKYAPSCLILGITDMGRPLHLHISRMNSPVVKIITLYEPSLAGWDATYSIRR